MNDVLSLYAYKESIELGMVPKKESGSLFDVPREKVQQMDRNNGPSRRPLRGKLQNRKEKDATRGGKKTANEVSC